MVRVRHMPGESLVRRRTLLLGVAAGATVAACAAEPGYPAGPLRIASGGNGGVYDGYAQGRGAVGRTALPRLTPAVLATAASVENLQLVATGGAEIGFTSADAAADAFRGRPPFPAALNVAALGRIYENYLHLVVRLDRGITRVADLKGRPVSIGAPGSGTELFATRLLPLLGLTVADLRAERLDPDVAADGVASGRVGPPVFFRGMPPRAVATPAPPDPLRRPGPCSFM